jgi:hypothetical protein
LKRLVDDSCFVSCQYIVHFAPFHSRFKV